MARELIGHNQPTQFPVNSTSSTLLYLGPSMNPTLVNLDVVHIVPYQEHTPKKGDVVAIRCHNSESPIIHRIVAILPEGIITQGDNNQQRDLWTIQTSDILGWVTSVQRGTRLLPVHAGFIGYSEFIWLRTLSTLKKWGACLMKYPYRYLISSEKLKKILSRLLVYRTIQYSGSARSEIQLYLGPFFIGRMRKGTNTWEIKPPFGIFFSSSITEFPEDDEVRGEEIKGQKPEGK